MGCLDANALDGWQVVASRQDTHLDEITKVEILLLYGQRFVYNTALQQDPVPVSVHFPENLYEHKIKHLNAQKRKLYNFIQMAYVFASIESQVAVVRHDAVSIAVFRKKSELRVCSIRGYDLSNAPYSALIYKV